MVTRKSTPKAQTVQNAQAQTQEKTISKEINPDSREIQYVEKSAQPVFHQIQCYSLLDFSRELESYILEGYRLDLSHSNVAPQQIGGMYFCRLIKES